MKLEGFIHNVSNEEYHAMTQAISFSGLKEFAKSPAHYQSYLKRKKEPTKAMEFGTAFHALIGEPELFAKKYVKAPEGLDKRTKEGKAAWAEFSSIHHDKQILSSDEYDKLDGMLNAILKNKTALKLLRDGKPELSAFWKDPETGVLCKCRPDYLRDDNVIIDLKSSEDASERGFEKAIGNFRYDMQTAFYLEGISFIANEPLTEFVHIVVEKNAPFAVANYALDDHSISYARVQIRQLLREYSECLQKGVWPAYRDEIRNVSSPNWLR